MNNLIRWLSTAALLICLGSGAATAQAGSPAALANGGDGGAMVAASTRSQDDATDVQVSSDGVNITNGASHVRIGNSGVDISNGSKSVVLVGDQDHSCQGDRQIVAIGHEAKLAAGHSACAVVSIFGRTVVDGDVSDSAVAIMGDLLVNGTVAKSAVSIFGNTHINGSVSGNAVAIFGDMSLGPNAVVQGQVVNILGSLHRSAGSVISGGTVNLMSGIFTHAHALQSWSKHCLILGRLLAPRLDIGWAWGIALGILLFYMLLAALFHEGVQRCVQTLEDHPGASILAALSMTLLTPILMMALVFTVIGVFAIPLFWLALLCASLFGRVIALGWLGARILRGARSRVVHPALSVLVGGVLVLLLYMVPVLGFIVYAVIGLLGFGAVTYTLLLALRAARGAPPPAAAPAATPSGGGEFTAADGHTGASGVGTTESAESAESAAESSPMAFATLPRAGFWIRMLALLIDVVLVGVVLGLIGRGSDSLLLVLAGYGAIMWKLRGTTVGGIICSLRVARIDGQPLGWDTAIVRALGCFLSLVAAGLGFFWIAFDREHQGWHDKIAGTVVVLVPKARGLV